MIICIDYDGTCVAHDYPRIGHDIGAVPVLKDLVAAGHKLILWTVRSDKYLQDAVDWFKGHGIPLYGVNYNRGQRTWSTSPKVHCDLSLDDRDLGCPLVHVEGGRPYVDWVRVRELLVEKGVLS